MAYPSGSTDTVTAVEEYILGPENIPFFTTQWYPTHEEPKAYIVFVHGFSEAIHRYHHFFRLLAAPPSSLHITAFDQRGHGRTSQEPLTSSSDQVKAWREEGKVVALEKGAKRRTGGWAKALPDIEWFVKRQSEVARSKGKKLFLHGFSMGGGEVLAFVTRPTAPPARETVSLLSGVIAGGALIRQTSPASSIQVKAGSVAANLGLGNFLMPAKMDVRHLSHNQASNERAKNDPFCEQTGSLRGLADMLNGGISLDSQATWNAWPKTLPLLVYHGSEDPICDPAAARRFGENAVASDKQVEMIQGMYHEVHNELEPVPTDLARMITTWVHRQIGDSDASAGQTAGSAVETSTNEQSKL